MYIYIYIYMHEEKEEKTLVFSSKVLTSNDNIVKIFLVFFFIA